MDYWGLVFQRLMLLNRRVRRSRFPPPGDVKLHGSIGIPRRVAFLRNIIVLGVKYVHADITRIVVFLYITLTRKQSDMAVLCHICAPSKSKTGTVQARRTVVFTTTSRMILGKFRECRYSTTKFYVIQFGKVLMPSTAKANKINCSAFISQKRNSVDVASPFLIRGTSYPVALVFDPSLARC